MEAVPPKHIANEPFLGMWFLGFACMARVNNASGKRVSCCDRVWLFATPGTLIFANKNQALE